MLYFTLTGGVLLSTLILWLPFLTRATSWLGLPIPNSDMLYLYKHYDGPLYVIVAKTLYKFLPTDLITQNLPLAPGYFAAHLPLYPLLIRAFSFLGYLKSMLIINILATISLTVFFFFMVKNLGLTKKPFLLALVFLFLPRFLVLRSVGAPESLFMFFILLSLYFFEKDRFWLAGLFGGLATMTKIPGILLFPAFGLVILEKVIVTKKTNGNWLGILLIPLGLAAVFGLYYLQYSDFFAYFHTGYTVPMPYPFSAFNHSQQWVGTAWLEEIIFYFFLYLLTVFSLKNCRYRSLYYFAFVFLVATTFVQHRDISRYSLPLWPLACIAFEKFFTSKKFLLALLILLPAIYLYAWNFLTFNIMPITEWKIYF